MNDIVKALRCGNALGSFCYKECEHLNQNYVCGLSEVQTRNQAADLIEKLESEVERLRIENIELRAINDAFEKSVKVKPIERGE